jgi:hypothetical protein
MRGLEHDGNRVGELMGIVFFSGMPSDAPGPVADTVTPILTCACAAAANVSAMVASRAPTMTCSLLFLCMNRGRVIGEAWVVESRVRHNPALSPGIWRTRADL